MLADLLPTQDSGGSSLAASVIKIVVGVLLVVLALRQRRERPASGDRAELPKWMARVDSMTPGNALVLGLLLSAVVPKNPVACSFGRSPRRRGRVQQRSGRTRHRSIHDDRHIDRGVPAVAHLVAPARMRGPFERLREWLVENNVAIMVVLLLVIGVVMIGNNGPYSFTGISAVRATSAMIRAEADHHAWTPSCFAVADCMPQPRPQGRALASRHR